MKSMGFIKPWRVHKIVFLHIYLKIMMSLPQSKYNQSFVFLFFFFIWEQRDRDNNKDSKEEARREKKLSPSFLST